MRIRLSLLIFFVIPTLSACGFAPVYGTHKQNNETPAPQIVFNDIAIAIIPDREGQYLRNALIDRLYSQGKPINPRYTLRVAPINEKIYDFDITQDSEATRRQLRLNSVMVLINNETKQAILSREITAIASNNILESEFSTLVTEQNARDNALDDLARQIERQLALYFK